MWEAPLIVSWAISFYFLISSCLASKSLFCFIISASIMAALRRTSFFCSDSDNWDTDETFRETFAFNGIVARASSDSSGFAIF